MDFAEVFYNASDFQIDENEFDKRPSGTVYVAKNIKDGKLYECKIMNTDDFNGYEQMLFMKESMILTKLKHSGIAAFKGRLKQFSSGYNYLHLCHKFIK